MVFAGIDGFSVDYGAENFGVEELLRSDGWGCYVVVEDDEVRYEAWFEAAFEFS